MSVTPPDPAELQTAAAAGLNDIFDLKWLQGDDVQAALSQWQQGDIVEDVRILWGTYLLEDPLVVQDKAVQSDGERESQAGLASDGIGLSEVEPTVLDCGWIAVRAPAILEDHDVDKSPPRTPGIITSQTCDIGASGPGLRHPTIQVSPLVRLDQLGERANSVREGRATDMVMVRRGAGLDKDLGDSQDEADVEWAADLRISIPVSKSVLISQKPKCGFDLPEECRLFADKVAMKYRRLAAHDAVSDLLIPGIEKVITKARGRGEVWMDRVEQVRVYIIEGSLLKPVALGLFVVILDEALTPEEQKPLRDWLNEVRSAFSAAADGCTLVPLRFKLLEKMSVKDYRESDHLAIPALRQIHRL